MLLDDITNDFNKMQGKQKLCNPCQNVCSEELNYSDSEFEGNLPF